jgi:hypothetical protein
MPDKQVFPNEDFLKLGLKIIDKLRAQGNVIIENPQVTKIDIDYDNVTLDPDGQEELVDVKVTFSSQSITYTVKENKKNPPIGSV